MIRHFFACNIGIIAWLAWRVHQGTPTESVITLGFLTVVTCNGALAIKWLRTKDRPKPVPSGEFPWRQWGIGHAVGIGFLVLIASQGYGVGDLAFLALLGFGGGNLLTVAFWLWDRHTIRRRQSEQQSPQAAPGK